MTGMDPSTRFATLVGVRVTAGDGTPCGCGATATLDDTADESPVPTGALLALVDATAREAAERAVAAPGRRATLVPLATGVQFRGTVPGPVTARASVPCEGVLVDRADEEGVFRFSVAVDVVASTGDRVAAGTVQWLARVSDADAAPTPANPVASAG